MGVGRSADRPQTGGYGAGAAGGDAAGRVQHWWRVGPGSAADG